jgi:hypothetical protein
MNLSRMSSYLEHLPFGLDSYPDHLQQASVFRAFVAFLPTHGLDEHLPKPLAALVRGDYAANDWLSEVHVTAIYLASADAHLPRDIDFVSKASAANRALFADPLYQMLMGSVRPEVMVKGAGQRFAVFHRGITLTAKLNERPFEAQFRMAFPQGLVPPLMSLCYGTAIEAAFLSAGAKEAWVSLISTDAVQNTFACSWR